MAVIINYHQIKDWEPYKHILLSVLWIRNPAWLGYLWEPESGDPSGSNHNSSFLDLIPSWSLLPPSSYGTTFPGPHCSSEMAPPPNRLQWLSCVLDELESVWMTPDILLSQGSVLHLDDPRQSPNTRSVLHLISFTQSLMPCKVTDVIQRFWDLFLCPPQRLPQHQL